MIGRHHLLPTQFAALARGHGGADAVAALRGAQLSKHLLLTKFIAGSWDDDRADRDAAVAVLAEAQAQAPQRISDLLGDPLVGAWAAWTTRRVRGSVRSQVPLAVDFGHLTSLAAVAARAARLNADLVLYARRGSVPLPTLGSVLLPVPDFTLVRITARRGVLTAHGGGTSAVVPEDPTTETGSWRGLRRLGTGRADRPFTVRLDDLDPYRGGHHTPAAERLPTGEPPRWQQLFAPAVALLDRHVPGRAGELAAGLRAVVPLTRCDPGSARSATIRDAFGTFGLTLPLSAVDFAVTLVHEFQHSKLSALLDLVPLYDRAHHRTYYAPWRTDPRPVGGLLQGVYAFLGVADLWCSLRGCRTLREQAEHEFAGIRGQVDHALGSLEASGGLTPAGQRFAAGMRSVVDTMVAEPLPAHVVRRAREALRLNQEAWSRRNGVRVASRRPGIDVRKGTLLSDSIEEGALPNA